ncbi:glycosyltransferase [Aquitalea sp. USM4]|uniref:glycosyltransferase n=1 Tax=Aquitalea sp. USM4 TaxID=1590041 RepID=UPI00103D3B6E|nr:glycosyltransferase [Aquitalea sp. USM4]QBJ78606.1 glycosyl transferase [Aquitalea sp. USM4]
MKISIIVACFNAIGKISRCLASLKKLDFDSEQIEVIFVDDHSLDGTGDLLDEVCKNQKNWKVVRLGSNSGSPSRPRNYGIQASIGKYIYFLDCDDELIFDKLIDLFDFAEARNACVVRSPIVIDDGKSRRVVNKINNWEDCTSTQLRVEKIIANQSTTVDSFIRGDLLRNSHIEWPEHLKTGEDTIFLSRVLAVANVVEYFESPVYIYHKSLAMTPSTTQHYDRRSLENHLEVWESVQSILKPVGVDYINIRLKVGLRFAIESLIFKCGDDVDEVVFNALSQFVNKNWSAICRFSYSNRISEVLMAVRDNDFFAFERVIRPRLLIAGHDLKFITDAIPELEKVFDIRIDEWKGHHSHDEAASRASLEWAEYIWCEWLLGNAEWYAKNKKSNQRLVVRMHRMELGRTHGEAQVMKNVDRFIVVSTFFFERLLERFNNIKRSDVRLVHNYVRYENYDRSWCDDRLFTIGLIGILPARKGFLEALHILNELHKSNSRFVLKVFGKRPEELSWVVRDESEMKYFTKCNEYIKNNGLENVVHFLGHSNIKIALASENVGFVLSVSDSDYGFPGPESFHLAIADGFASGCVSLVKHWPGAEYIWPSEYIFNNSNEIVRKISYLSKSKVEFLNHAKAGFDFVASRYNVGDFVKSIKTIFSDLV